MQCTFGQKETGLPKTLEALVQKQDARSFASEACRKVSGSKNEVTLENYFCFYFMRPPDFKAVVVKVHLVTP